MRGEILVMAKMSALTSPRSTLAILGSLFRGVVLVVVVTAIVFRSSLCSGILLWCFYHEYFCGEDIVLGPQRKKIVKKKKNQSRETS